jgi:putative serine protease PepD
MSPYIVKKQGMFRWHDREDFISHVVFVSHKCIKSSRRTKSSRSRARPITGEIMPKRAKASTLLGPVLGAALAVGLLAGCTVGSGVAGPGQASPAETGTSAGAGAGAGASPSAGAGPGTETDGPAAAVAVQQDFVSVIRRVLPSVVEIRTNNGLGSGVVLDSDGDIVTNAHVVEGASSFQVVSASPARRAGQTVAGQELTDTAVQAALVGSCPADDLAVIRVRAGAGLLPATFADGSSVSVGDIVLAIGSPLGLGGSVTEGIVSAIGRSVAEPASVGAPAAVLADAIQTSAAINPGNSGGALVSIDGAVVGIPTLAAVNGAAGGAAPGIGFAIPASLAVSVGRELTGTGGVNPGSVPSGCHR